MSSSTSWLRALGFEGVVPEATGHPAYHPATMPKIYVYGFRPTAGRLSLTQLAQNPSGAQQKTWLELGIVTISSAIAAYAATPMPGASAAIAAAKSATSAALTLERAGKPCRRRNRA